MLIRQILYIKSSLIEFKKITLIKLLLLQDIINLVVNVLMESKYCIILEKLVVFNACSGSIK